MEDQFGKREKKQTKEGQGYNRKAIYEAMQKVESQDPPQVLSFAIICPQWIEDARAEDTESLLHQIVCYIHPSDEDTDAENTERVSNAATITNTQWLLPWAKKADPNTEEADSGSQWNTFSPNVSDHEIVKQIGLLQAIADISGKFNAGNGTKSTQVSYIDTDKTRTVVGWFPSAERDGPGGFWFFCEFQSTKVTLTNGEVRYIQRGLASPEYLRQQIFRGYELWCLNHGSLEFCDSQMDMLDLKHLATRWWQQWFRSRFEFASSYDATDDALFKLLPGIRYSCVDKPLGFSENINKELNAFVEAEESLKDVIVLNTNWTPEKNWGVICINDHSIYSQWSLQSLISFFKDIDLTFGLSTYALTYGNRPSLKQYLGSLKRMQSIKPDGGLLERSLMEPALYLQQKFANSVFNPFGNVIDTFESYIPSMTNIMNISGYVPFAVPSITESVKNATLHPWNSLTSYWGAAPEIDPPNAEEHQSEAHDPSPSSVPSGEQESQHDRSAGEVSAGESRSPSRKTVQSSIYESMEVAQKSGSYLLGCTKQGSIVLHDFFLYSREKEKWETVKLIIYEINGILFVLFFDSNYELLKHSTEFYDSLSKKLDSVYEVYFTDLIFNQLKSLEDDMKSKNRDDFAFIIYDQEKYWTNISNIPPDHETLMHQIPERVQLLEQNINGTDLEFIRTLALMQDRQLQGVIANNIAPSPGWVGHEKITKLGRTRWCLFHRYSDTKWVVVVKQMANVDGANGFMWGEDVKKWMSWVESDGYL